MALIPAKVIARIRATTSSDHARLTWEWVLRADGQISYRLTEVGGHWERNPWRLVTRLSATQLLVARRDPRQGENLLADLAHQHGHLCVPRISSAALTCKVAFSLVRP
jgi:hypothetical protein